MYVNGLIFVLRFSCTPLWLQMDNSRAPKPLSLSVTKSASIALPSGIVSWGDSILAGKSCDLGADDWPPTLLAREERNAHDAATLADAGRHNEHRGASTSMAGIIGQDISPR